MVNMILPVLPYIFAILTLLPIVHPRFIFLLILVLVKNVGEPQLKNMVVNRILSMNTYYT